MKLLKGLFCALFLFVNVLAAEEAAEPAKKDDGGSAKEKMDAFVQLGPGVHKVDKDAKGRVVRAVVVGQARISTVLGAAKGNEMARKKAAQSAKAEFVKWLGDKVEVHESSENEATLFLTGEEGNDKDTLNESGKAVEKTSDSYKSVAEGLVRGLVMLHSDVNAEEKTCTVVYGWSLKNQKAAKDAATNDPGIDEKPATGAAKSNTDKKKIRSKKATSDEADEFLK